MTIPVKPLLDVRSLSVAFRTPQGSRLIIDQVSFVVYPGETYALLGESGSGKSVTALSLLQLLPHHAQFSAQTQIHFDGSDISTFSEAQLQGIRGRRIAMVFQEPMTSLNPVMTIYEQISEVLRLHFSLSSRQCQARVLSLLEQVGIPSAIQRMHDYPHQLSGGMKQRVMIAMALACEPDILIADEPTTALDVTIQSQVLSLLRQLQKATGMAMILITHDLGVVRQMADRVGVMYAGQLIETATCEDLFAHPMHPYTQKLFAAMPSIDKRHLQLSVMPANTVPPAHDAEGCHFADRCPFAMPVCTRVAPTWFGPSPGHQARCYVYDPLNPPDHVDELPQHDRTFPAPQTPPARVLGVADLRVLFPIRKGLFRRTIGHVHAVDGVSFSLYSGKTLALVGESGCGKTTLGRAMLQLISATSGDVQYGDIPLHRLTQRQMRQHRRDIQIIFQDPFSSMNPRCVIHDILAEGMLAFGLYPSRAAREERVGELLSLVGLDPAMQWRYPHEFSGGQRQRIAIARALAVEPKVIICDEPTSALDISVQASILNLLKRLQSQFGYAYLFITHNLSVVSYLADEVAVMYLGKIVEQGPAETVLAQPKHPYTQMLLNSVPSLDERHDEVVVPGEMPSPIAPPSGCHFHPRCVHAMPVCHQAYPPSYNVGDAHTARCYRYELHPQSYPTTPKELS